MTGMSVCGRDPLGYGEMRLKRVVLCWEGFPTQLKTLESLGEGCESRRPSKLPEVEDERKDPGAGGIVIQAVTPASRVVGPLCAVVALLYLPVMDRECWHECGEGKKRHVEDMVTVNPQLLSPLPLMSRCSLLGCLPICSPPPTKGWLVCEPTL